MAASHHNHLALAFSSAGWIFYLHDMMMIYHGKLLFKKMWEKSTPPNLPPFQARIFRNFFRPFRIRERTTFRFGSLKSLDPSTSRGKVRVGGVV
jgi:hypothetical protein